MKHSLKHQLQTAFQTECLELIPHVLFPQIFRLYNIIHTQQSHTHSQHTPRSIFLSISPQYMYSPLHLCCHGNRWVLFFIYWQEVVDSVSYTTGSCKMMFPISYLVYSVNYHVYSVSYFVYSVSYLVYSVNYFTCFLINIATAKTTMCV